MRERQKWYHMYIPILTGGLIYTLFRVDSLLIFRVFEYLHIDSFIRKIRETTMFWDVPEFVKYSLPDGLWVYAFAYFIFSIWKYDKSEGLEKYVFMLFPLVCGVGGEVSQLFLDIVGTFDWQDLLISVIAYSVAYLAVHPSMDE